ncbi:MAG: glycosyltransferase family 9 protein [Prevotellaceae bacterium]|jgi:ADP-heptose:LPS heptosyltransferase|nr:glycosyltransferase family 9 protein [Prevotellaceae bacterium]
MPQPKHILVIRLSAIGDVAMAAPVVRQFAEQFPAIRFTMVSQPFLQPLFQGLPNLQFVGANVYDDCRGLRGLWKLFRVLRSHKPDAVADIHNVLRTVILRILFAASGKRTCFIKKGLFAKKALTRRRWKRRRPVKTTFDRYRRVLEKCTGAKLPPDAPYRVPVFKSDALDVPAKAVGIAPFARHKGKIYPPDRMEQVVVHLAMNRGMTIYLFGSAAERSFMEYWEYRYPNVRVVAGKLNLHDELALMQQLPLMITMDSANMHLASFAGTPVLSVWGATHPRAGFYGWQQAPDNAISADLPCRPCSVFGNKPCFVGGYLCLRLIEPKQIIEAVSRTLSKLKVES